MLAGLMWGSRGLFIRQLSSFGLNNYVTIFGRMFSAALFLGLIFLIKDPRLFKVSYKDWTLMIGSGVIGMGIINVFYNIAII
ncbi:EamA family transporter [Eremococcus coleocola]|uniref:EamA domain-containing protein n=1 Tax=Eremococcus coleocola ACS-139-V-Col8 TaxID=908337 RepID=E4KNB5_9LACT|nr:EamA family transporter [Eremococcus coleocola]EFR31565.1 hypothetical protein HMPREF9257_1136 [Eremococcus coleocola ACS-139-V-Col8]